MAPQTAFAAPAAVAARGLAPAAVSSRAPAAPTMSLISRRAALGAALAAVGAALVPRSASAKSGEGAKLSVFGVGGASSPFDAGIERSGTVVYEAYSEDEIAYFKQIVDGSVNRLKSAKDSIDIKSWEDIRSTIRLEMTLLRQTCVKINDNIQDKKTKSAAEKLYSDFKRDVNDLDYACVTKSQDKAMKYYKSTIADLADWRKTVGI